MILASNVLYLLSNFKETVKQLRSKVVHSNPFDINSLEKNSFRSPLTTITHNLRQIVEFFPYELMLR